ncbi:MAG: sigma-70 family RNA polymerase sigma factor [Betaproteobacteria bacterium]|jgi:RNA polymerase sigma-70 factor (ECF subfamily)|nr:sigma-70 family RNA polymerase sigma factor [Betaproteobacteria bacterium]
MSANERAFEAAVRTHSRELFRYAYWLCRDRGRAEDLVQDAFARAWSSWADLRDAGARRSWLYTIVRNEFLRGLEKKQLDYDDRDVSDIDVAVESRPDIAIDLRRALEALPESLREPLLLQVLGGFSGGEIAGMLSTTEGAVMTRLTRARQAVRRLLERGLMGQEMAQ